MLVTQFDKFVNRSTQEILGDEIVQENLEPMLSTDIVRDVGYVTGVKGDNEIYYRTGNVNLTPADIGALDGNNIYNGLDKTTEGYALDARQGKVLADDVDGKLNKANVYNGLDKTVDSYALDARQGKVLNDKINATQSDIAIIIDGNQTTHTGGVAVGEYVIVRNSTIFGITDGLYNAVQAIPANTAITSAYLAEVDGGGLNELNSNITTINSKLTTQDVASLFTNINSNVDIFNAKKGAKTVFISFSIATGVANATQLVEIPSTLKPALCDYIAPLSNSKGKIYTDGSVWIERSAQDKIVYYGTTLPEKKYVNISYLLE